MILLDSLASKLFTVTPTGHGFIVETHAERKGLNRVRAEASGGHLVLKT